MNPKLFDALLYEDESETLDFKRDQYRFAKASSEEKSELLKDIVGFANAWRRTDAYILIGVEEVRGGRSVVVGVADPLDDHSLQQFVASLLDRPVRFRYEVFAFEGKDIGIIKIEQQPRPFRLTRDFGKLKKGAVYVRRGSSTDPTKPASPDEVAEMLIAAASVAQQAELTVEFAHVDRNASLGAATQWSAEFCEMPPSEAIPDFGRPPSAPSVFDVGLLAELQNRTNREYYRDYAEYSAMNRFLHPVRLVVRNVGSAVATDVRLEMETAVEQGVVIYEAGDVLSRPTRRESQFNEQMLGKLRPAARDPGEVDIHKDGHRFTLQMDCGNLQPGRRVWSEMFYVGVATRDPVVLQGQLYAGTLSTPQDFALTVTAAVSRREVSVDELISLADREPDD